MAVGWFLGGVVVGAGLVALVWTLFLIGLGIGQHKLHEGPWRGES
jgi:hypothetical protein